MTESARRPTAHDVARLAGVSQATVSYVLNGRRDRNARISEDTRRRILQVTAQLGYVPNQAARSLRRRRTERIAVVVKEIGLPYNDALIQRMQRAADEQHYSAIVMVASSDDQERLVLDQLRRGLVDGAAIMADRFDGASSPRWRARAWRSSRRAIPWTPTASTSSATPRRRPAPRRSPTCSIAATGASRSSGRAASAWICTVTRSGARPGRRRAAGPHRRHVAGGCLP